jgi:hypothetical protein
MHVRIIAIVVALATTLASVGGTMLITIVGTQFGWHSVAMLSFGTVYELVITVALMALCRLRK